MSNTLMFSLHWLSSSSSVHWCALLNPAQGWAQCVLTAELIGDVLPIELGERQNSDVSYLPTYSVNVLTVIWFWSLWDSCASWNMNLFFSKVYFLSHCLAQGSPSPLAQSCRCTHTWIKWPQYFGHEVLQRPFNKSVISFKCAEERVTFKCWRMLALEHWSWRPLAE